MKQNDDSTKTTKEEQELLEYCRIRLKCYAILTKKHGHEKTCRILKLYD